MRNLTNCLFTIILTLLYFQSSPGQTCLPGGFSPTTQAEIDNFQTTYPGCTVIQGNVIISGTGITNLNGLSVITEINGNLNISNTSMTSCQGLNNLLKVGGILQLNNINSLTSLSGLNKLDSVGANLELWDLPALAEITDLINLKYLGTLYIVNCDLLPDLTGLNNLQTIQTWIAIFDNAQLSSLTGLDHHIDFYGDILDIGNNPLLSVCDVPVICDIISLIGAGADIYNNAPGCNSWSEVDGQCLADATTQALASRGKGAAVNTDGSKPDSSAILDIESSTSALIIPRLSFTEIRALIDPAPGMIVYDKTRRKIYYYDGTSWIPSDEGMGDHSATRNLNMNQFDIENVKRIVSNDVFLNDIGISKKLYDKDLDEGNPAQILSSTGTGVDWVDLPSSADNLGNHTATQDLNLNGHEIALNGGWLSGDGDEEGVFISNLGAVGIGTSTPIADLQVGGFIGSALNREITIQDYPNNPFFNIGRDVNNKAEMFWWDSNDAWVFRTKKNGTSYENTLVIKNGKIGINTPGPAESLDISGTANMTGFKLSPMGPAGHILTSDGVQGIWQAPISSADNLGNHTATQNINLNSNWLSGDGANEGVYVDGDGLVGIGTNAPSDLLDVNGVAKMSGFKLSPMGPAGHVLTSDGVQGIWQAPAPTMDNLGNHIATQNIRLSGNWLSGDGGNEGVFVTNDGKVGIGTSSPFTNMHIVKSSTGTPLINTTTLLIQESMAGADADISIMGSVTGDASIFFGDEAGYASGAIRYSNSSEGFTFKTNGVHQMFLNNQGHLGIQVSNPSATLDISGTLQLDIFGKATGKVLGSIDNMGNAEWVDPSDDDWEISGNNLYGLIPNASNLGIGTTTPIRKVHIKQGGPIDGILLEYSEDTDYWTTYIDGVDDYNFGYNGSLISYIKDQDGTYNISSDKRLKSGIKPISQTLSRVLSLNPVLYRYKNSKPNTKLSIGLIAQEVQQLFPETVTEKNGYLSINYDAFAVIAIKSIQEQQEIIDEQQKILDELIRRIEALERH